jgi:hypothetical protein
VPLGLDALHADEGADAVLELDRRIDLHDGREALDRGSVGRDSVDLVHCEADLSEGKAVALVGGHAREDPDLVGTEGRKLLENKRFESLASSGKNTPFAGYELEGRACCTIVGGDVRFDRLAPGT